MSAIVLLLVYSKTVVPSVLASLKITIQLYPDDQIVKNTLGKIIEKMSLKNDPEDVPVAATAQCALLKLSGGNIANVKPRIISFMCKNPSCRSVLLGSDTNHVMSQILGSKSSIRRQRVLQLSGFELSCNHHFSFDDIALTDWSKLLASTNNTEHESSSSISDGIITANGYSRLNINRTVMERHIIEKET
uniref:Uncharacterized protein n=1 Tax=Glypta fumiferanae TaxID=389681 RepID=A0A0F7DKA9_9HYME|nr:hypothetical protein [Glypta fumiferanae]